ncbi:Cnrip1 [Columba livia]|nr:Cnrip1 [Columba livia]
MGDIPNLVKISVSLKIQPNDGAVYFKVDGQRFGQNRTIKLLTGAKYKIEVAIRPGTVQATTMGIGGVSVPLEEKSRDAQVASYTGIYDTEGVAHTKSGERQPIQVNMQYDHLNELKVMYQMGSGFRKLDSRGYTVLSENPDQIILRSLPKATVSRKYRSNMPECRQMM